MSGSESFGYQDRGRRRALGATLVDSPLGSGPPGDASPRRKTDRQSKEAIVSVRYGLGILALMVRYLTHQSGLLRQRQFENLMMRYTKAG